MLLTIRHDTHYRYAAPVTYSIQQLRMTPASGTSQLVRDWHISAPGKLDAARDAYGNTLHTLVLTKPHSEILVSVAGEVETEALIEGRLFDGAGPIPLEHFTCATTLTAPDAAIRELAHGSPMPDSAQSLISMAERIAARVCFRTTGTAASRSAAHTLEAGEGVCQNIAHLMLACCRVRGVPARYVSGYFNSDDERDAQCARHAWVDVWAEHGWISVDAAHASFADARHCRIAVARDAEAAAPVRGSRVGGQDETLTVHVAVDSPRDQ